jgi:hypothetical protein
MTVSSSRSGELRDANLLVVFDGPVPGDEDLDWRRIGLDSVVSACPSCPRRLGVSLVLICPALERVRGGTRCHVPVLLGESWNVGGIIGEAAMPAAPIEVGWGDIAVGLVVMEQRGEGRADVFPHSPCTLFIACPRN